MKVLSQIVLLTILATVFITQCYAQHAQHTDHLERLSQTVLDITPPSAKVSGPPGNMQIIDRSCREWPMTELRQRIVNVAVQEWAFFGLNIVDQTRTRPTTPFRFWFSRVDADEAARLADSIAGYWAAAPDSSWILERQNSVWQRAQSTAVRWRDAWSAAFISWVMCESGLGDLDQFQRAIAHHNYIDQAIRARDGSDTQAVYEAYDPGEASLGPGDMLCRGSRPVYRNIAQRRAQMGVGARTHCDIVVKVDEENSQIMAIGGNVRGSVRLKLLPARIGEHGHFAALPFGGRSMFAHLRLTAESTGSDLLDQSPTMQAVACKESVPEEVIALLNRETSPTTANC